MNGNAGRRVAEKENAPGICLCAFPWATEAGRIHSIKSVCVLRAVTERLQAITGLSEWEADCGPVKMHRLRSAISLQDSGRRRWVLLPKWAMNYLAIQVEMARHFLNIADEVDTVVFGEGPHYILPAIAARLRKKKIIKYSTATVAEQDHHQGHPWGRFGTFAFGLFEAAILKWSDLIVVPPWKSTAGILTSSLRRKTTSATICSCVRDGFREIRSWRGREDVIGYVGGLTEAEGALQFARAIPLILLERDARFLIVGDGILMNKIKKYLSRAGCLPRVEFTGRVSSDELPYYLNRMKFHIQPSYDDCTGAINVEAMACGTVVLASGVGGIPNVVVDGQTGFLMPDNRPETIAETLLKVWARADLEQVRRNGVIFAGGFYYQNVAAVWTSLLRELENGGPAG